MNIFGKAKEIIYSHWIKRSENVYNHEKKGVCEKKIYFKLPTKKVMGIKIKKTFDLENFKHSFFQNR